MIEIREEEKACICRLRDVETKVQVLNKKKRTYEKDINYLKRPYVAPEVPRKPIINVFEMLEEVALVFCIFGILFLCSLSSDRMIIVLCVCVAFFIAYVCFIFMRTNNERVRYKLEFKEYEQKCEKNLQRLKADRLVAEARQEEFKAVSAKLEKLLQEREWLYKENHIPMECRNIRCVYYICDMVVNEKLSVEKAVESIGAEGLGALLEKYDEAVEVECLRLAEI